MIQTIPYWLQNAIDFLNIEFQVDEDVNVSILYGFDSVCVDEDNCGFAAYNNETKSIFLADPAMLIDICETEEDVRQTTIMNLFHEYRHHQQCIDDLDLSEDDAEDFAKQMYEEYINIVERICEEWIEIE